MLFTLALAISANAHSLIMSVDGANGNSASGFGVKQSTPRNGIDEVSGSSRSNSFAVVSEAD
jgi:hypothetical protein